MSFPRSLPVLVALSLCACGDPIQVGDASRKQQEEEDRALVELAEQIAGEWSARWFPPGVTDPSLSVEILLTFVPEGQTRSGDYLPGCDGTLCDLPDPGENVTLRELLGEGGAYSLASFAEDGSALVTLSDFLGGVTVLSLSANAQRLSLPFIGRTIQFTRESSAVQP